MKMDNLNSQEVNLSKIGVATEILSNNIKQTSQL